MIRTNRHRMGAASAWLGAAWLLATVLACSTGGASAPTSGSAGAAGRTLTDVRVERTAGATVVTLLGVGKPEYRSYEETSPRRLVIELPGVRPDRLAERVAIREGGVSEIGVVERNGTTVVELALAPGARADVVPRNDRLEVRVRQTVPSSSAAASVDSGPPAVSAGPPAGESDLSNLPAANDDSASTSAPASAPAAESAPAPAPAPKKAAAPAATSGEHSLTAIEPLQSPEGTVLLLRSDARIDGAQSFVLEHPDRLVLDLAGVKNAVKSARVDVNSAEVSHVRIAQHQGKVRVVMDAGTASQPFARKHLVPTDQGLVVAVNTSDTVAAQVAGAAPIETAASAPASPEPAAAPTPTESAAPAATAEATTPQADLPRITSVRLESDEQSDRVVVVSSGGVKSGAMLKPDDDTVVLRFLGATLDPSVTTKIVPEKAGSVSMVTAFEQPPGKRQKQPEVRIVVRRAAGIEPKVTRGDGVATFTFAHGAVVAKKPPMMGAPDEGTTATAAASAAPASGRKSSGAAAPAASDGVGSSEILQEGGLVTGKEYSGRRISLDLRDVEIDDVLRLIAEVSDLNVIAGDDVTGKVTIRLVDVPWDQALDVILLTKGLGFVRVGNVLRIAPTTMLQQEEEARLQERRSKEKLADLAVKLQPVNYASVKEVEKMVKRLLTPRGVVNIDERTSTLIIKDIPQVIDEATALIKAIDTQTPQVMIEAKIVEANLDFSREIGAVWGLGVNPFTDGFDNQSDPKRNVGSQDVRLHDNRNLLPGSGGLNNVAVANPITNIANGLLNVGSFLLDQRFNVELQLQAAESNGEGKVISSPRVVTLDNREAKIEQGVSIPFQTFENGDAQLEFIDAVLSLLVTPHITADKSIIMKVEVTRNAPDDSVQTPTGSPAIAKNQAKTETLVRDGQTLVIGGIYVVNKSDHSSRVPYLHKIPLLGNAFKNSEIRDIRKELLIFVTPRIVDNQEVAAQ